MKLFKKPLYKLYLYLQKYFTKNACSVCQNMGVDFNEKEAAKVHENEKENLLKILNVIEDNDNDNKNEKLFLLESFLSTNEHLTIDKFVEFLKKNNRETKPENVEKALELFTKLGFAEKHYNNEGQALYEHRHPNIKHDHLTCISCGETKEFFNKKLERILEDCVLRQNFIPISHSFNVRGLCSKCKEKRGEKMPLSAAVVGERVEIIDILGESALRSHLIDMGLNKGVVLYIMGQAKGSVIVLFEGSRVALGCDTAKHILIKQIPALHANSGLSLQHQYGDLPLLQHHSGGAKHCELNCNASINNKHNKHNKKHKWFNNKDNN